MGYIFHAGVDIVLIDFNSQSTRRRETFDDLKDCFLNPVGLGESNDQGYLPLGGGQGSVLRYCR
jgi:hypothetical protein